MMENKWKTRYYNVQFNDFNPNIQTSISASLPQQHSSITTPKQWQPRPDKWPGKKKLPTIFLFNNKNKTHFLPPGCLLGKRHHCFKEKLGSNLNLLVSQHAVNLQLQKLVYSGSINIKNSWTFEQRITNAHWLTDSENISPLMVQWLSHNIIPFRSLKWKPEPMWPNKRQTGFIRWIEWLSSTVVISQVFSKLVLKVWTRRVWPLVLRTSIWFPPFPPLTSVGTLLIWAAIFIGRGFWFATSTITLLYGSPDLFFGIIL